MIKNEKIKFDKALEELEEINRRLESGDLEIEEALALYKKGVNLYKICQKKFKEAEAVFREIGGED